MIMIFPRACSPGPSSVMESSQPQALDLNLHDGLQDINAWVHTVQCATYTAAKVQLAQMH